MYIVDPISGPSFQLVACCNKGAGMSVHTRKHFRGPFKATVALEAIRAVKTMHEIAQEDGVPPTQVGLWTNELQVQAASLVDTKRGPKPADPLASPEQLSTGIRRVTMELDWFKKSQESPCGTSQAMGQPP